MEGRGVTNYSTDKPSYPFSTATTEFDDALISRGIVTFEQAMIAKGASPAEALRLSKLHARGHEISQDHVSETQSNNEQSGGVDDNSVSVESDGDDDEAFMKKYRQMRINEMRCTQAKHNHLNKFGDVICISRSEWNREVNEASKDGLWVVVNLICSSSCLSGRHDELCDKVQDIVIELADRFDQVKFVIIPSNSAIENWPVENLPTLFCYRFGKLQHQLIGIGSFDGTGGLNRELLEAKLAKLGVLNRGEMHEPNSSSGDKSIAGRPACWLERENVEADSDYSGVD